eukprot:CAMPEP_0115725440 /NCGR_PEP_ID=MMETSP0272-20121206/81312_1 /TAXON_ID=71861 /ORGANISM="Scrippsiella trochoidea, Strain CCMP3099" /LENGTH=59 /DNA_ID=CAMNT_0003168729 /DNA_START=106 /DNA_END=282 /DNA_ORIENTATION=+
MKSFTCGFLSPMLAPTMLLSASELIALSETAALSAISCASSEGKLLLMQPAYINGDSNM